MTAELILASVPSGPQTHVFIERLTAELGVWSVVLSHARMAVADGARRRTRLVQSRETDELTVLCPADKADAVFALAVQTLGVHRPNNGMVRRVTPRRAEALVMGLPEDAEALEKDEPGV